MKNDKEAGVYQEQKKETKMDIKELSIGNWVNQSGNDFQWSEDDFGRRVIDFCNPILITAEWLERFGFYQDNPQEDHFLDLPDFTIFWGSGCLWIENPTTEPFILDHIKSVHQLQNLYFALTGKDLATKINL